MPGVCSNLGHILNFNVFAGHSTEVARGLVECSAELNCRDQAGNTPWHIAAKAGQTNMMLFLLEAGSDKELRNDAGCTAVHLAAQSGDLKSVQGV